MSGTMGHKTTQMGNSTAVDKNTEAGDVANRLRALLNSREWFANVDDASDGVPVSAVPRLLPGVVVLDVSVPGMNGVQVATQLKQMHPDVTIVVLTVDEEGSSLSSPSVAERDQHRGSAIAGQPVGRLGQATLSWPTTPLSAREQEVIRYVAHGYSNKEIALKLDVSVKTVETYRYRAGEKLGATSRVELVRHAIKQGWLNHELSSR